MRLRIERSHMKPQSITTNSRFTILQHETRLSGRIPSITLQLDVHPLFAHLIPKLRAFRLACKPWWPQTKSGSCRYWKYLLKVKVYQSLGVQTFNHICLDAVQDLWKFRRCFSFKTNSLILKGQQETKPRKGIKVLGE